MAFHIGAKSFLKSHLNLLIRLFLILNKKDCTYIQNKIKMGRLEICKTKIASHADALHN